MQRLVMKQVDVFTRMPFSGNPAGVITEADALSSDMMLKIAGEMNLSETTYVISTSSDEIPFRVRFFTPSEEIRLSGHAMIAACYALLEEGRIAVEDGVTKVPFETMGGIMQLDIHFRRAVAGRDDPPDAAVLTINGVQTGTLEKIMLHQTVKRHRPSNVSAQEIAKILGIAASDILKAGLPLEIISTSLEQLMIPIASKETIRDMNPDLIGLGIMNKKCGIQSNHVFTTDTYTADCSAYMRHFAPALGIWEDPAAGTAVAALASYLLRHGIITADSIIVEQGKEIDRLARVLVDTLNPENPLGEMRIGGIAVTSIARRITIENGELVVS